MILDLLFIYLSILVATFESSISYSFCPTDTSLSASWANELDIVPKKDENMLSALGRLPEFKEFVAGLIGFETLKL